MKFRGDDSFYIEIISTKFYEEKFIYLPHSMEGPYFFLNKDNPYKNIIKPLIFNCLKYLVHPCIYIFIHFEIGIVLICSIVLIYIIHDCTLKYRNTHTHTHTDIYIDPSTYPCACI